METKNQFDKKMMELDNKLAYTPWRIDDTVEAVIRGRDNRPFEKLLFIEATLDMAGGFEEEVAWIWDYMERWKILNYTTILDIMDNGYIKKDARRLLAYWIRRVPDCVDPEMYFAEKLEELGRLVPEIPLQPVDLVYYNIDRDAVVSFGKHVGPWHGTVVRYHIGKRGKKIPIQSIEYRKVRGYESNSKDTYAEGLFDARRCGDDSGGHALASERLL